VSGNRKLAAATGAEVCLHELADVAFPFRKLRDGEELHVGQLVLRIIHTPGHRPESMSILVINPPRSPYPSMVLSGDTLFVGDVGRPDFGGPEGACEEYRSVQKLLQLEDYVEVFPAHFEGFCGKGMCGRPSSTIGFERRFNPLLQLSEGEFVRLASEVPARPLNMTAILDTNRGLGNYEWAIPTEEDGEVKRVEVNEAPNWLRDRGAIVLDVREPWEYQAGHIPGAVLIPQADLALRLSEIPKERDVLVVCAAGARSQRAAQFLKQVGYDRVASLEGGTSGWVKAGNPVEAERGEAAPASL
jgi:rhodanese-related sulfurtransferase